MTETEWLASTDPAAMLALPRCPSPPPSDRKLRLFACGCCRQVWDKLTGPRSRNAVEVAERFADGEVTETELNQAIDGAWEVFAQAGDEWNGPPTLLRLYHNHPEYFSDCWLPYATQAALLRDTVGNPFRPVTLPVQYVQDCPSTCLVGGRGMISSLPTKCGGCETPWRKESPWLTPTVLGLAEAAYSDRINDAGHLDPVRLAILADALEEAGCQGERCPACGPDLRSAGILPRYWCGQCDERDRRFPHPILAHLRSPGPHVRGCHVVDLILGKS